MPPPNQKDGLARYYDKRRADETPEPYGGAARPRVFVVQKHAARRLHYDLRLEMDGVLKSWAVPRGISFDPAVKRLAVRTEDHPVDYVDFEGVIPAGNYGAGAMIVWDRGVWTPLENPDTGMKKGKLLFALEGYKLRGVFTLVKTKGNDNEWLLIKKPDAYSGDDAERAPPQASILSGLTVEQLAAGESRVESVTEAVDAAAEAYDAPSRRVDLMGLEPMLAEPYDAPFTKAGWLFELKYDGFRLLAGKREGKVTLRYRSGREVTRVFPDVVRALEALPFDDVVLDGEVTALGADGKPELLRLQRRVQLANDRDIRLAAAQLPATYYVFDLLGYAQYDLRRLPLLERKALLAQVVPQGGVVRYGDHIETQGEAFFAQVRAMDLEGMVGKRADAPYRAGRSDDWRKVRFERTDDFVIVGFNESDRPGRPGFRGLHLATGSGPDLVYVGRVGSGFSQQQLVEIRALLDERIRDTPAFLGEPSEARKANWVEPELVCEVRYLLRTEDGHLRHPVFLRMREDKTLEDFIDPEPEAFVAADEGPAGGDPFEGKKVPFTNLDKVFWPDEGYTKGDLIEFYRAVAPWILPYLKDRPVVLTRYPDGIDGKSFFQKDAPPHVPGWVRTERMYSEHAKREIDYFVADDVETLTYLANLGSIPLHVWSSRVANLQRPDWSVIDLDPKEAPFAHVVTLANEVRALCAEIGLPCYPKTSGSTGLHVLVPLGGTCTFAQSRALAELISRIVVTRHPDIATIARAIGARGGRVYLDYLQNGHGQLLAAPLSVRPRPGATVSTPLSWDEVNPDLDPNRFTIRTVLARLEAQSADPLAPVLTERPALSAALDRLGQILS